MKLIFDMAMIYEAAAANVENISNVVETLLKDKSKFQIKKQANSIRLNIFKGCVGYIFASLFFTSKSEHL